jgi:pyruvate/2-oxoglutarate dehydrogenase complex dihydrolipoamide dehydrogenase (E3) component
MDWDLVVVGGGSAGYAGARTAAALGLKTAVVDSAEELGGLCILRGCMPSKALLSSANRMLAVRTAGSLGVRAREPEADVAAMVARKRHLIAQFADYRREQLEKGPFELIRGRARLLGPHEIEVGLREGGFRRIHARSILLATGSRPAPPPIPGLRDCRPLTSDEVLDATSLPKSVAVLGAGPVSLELAHYMQALGVAVTIIQRSPQFLRGVDADLAAEVEAAYRERGMAVFTGTELMRIEGTRGDCQVWFRHAGGEGRVGSEAVFDGLGRAPALDGLGIEEAGLERSGKGLHVGPNQATSVPHIFAAGDCAGPYEIVHIAIQQAEVAARNAARILGGREAVEQTDYRLRLYAVFTEPQVAVVGLAEDEAREAGKAVAVARYPFNDHGKSLVLGDTRGFVKLLANPETREILGGAVVGPHASDLIHEIVVAMGFRATAGQLAALPHYHPTLSEIWSYPAEELAG